MSTSEILSGLRDVHEPLPPEASLPWLLLANLLVVVAIAAILLHRRWRARRAWRRAALAAIRQASHLPPQAARTSLAKTLRQVMLLLDGPQINGLSGEPWLQRLDDRFNTNWFTGGSGRVFGDALYAPCTLTPEALRSLCEHLDVLVQSLPVETGNPTSLPRRVTATHPHSASPSTSSR